jgi:hypothetical protein
VSHRFSFILTARGARERLKAQVSIALAPRRCSDPRARARDVIRPSVLGWTSEAAEGPRRRVLDPANGWRARQAEIVADREASSRDVRRAVPLMVTGKAERANIQNEIVRCQLSVVSCQLDLAS